MSSKIEDCLEIGRRSAQILRSSGRYRQLVPRSSPERALQRFCDDNDRGYFVVVGEPGIGKTGFSLHLADEAPLSYFFQRRTWSAGLSNFLNYMAAELHLMLDSSSLLLHWVSDPMEAHARVNMHLHELGAAGGRGRRFVIPLDALDEADLRNAEDAQLLKFELPPDVYVVCTLRPVPQLVDRFRSFADAEVFEWKADSSTVREVQTYVVSHLATEQADPGCTSITDLARGNFLVASQLLRTHKEGDPLLNLTAGKPLTLSALYHHDWQHRVLPRAAMAELCHDIATVFAAAREPLSTSVLRMALCHLRADNPVKGRDVKRSLALRQACLG